MSATRVLVRCNTLGDVQGLVLRVSVDLVVAQTLLRRLPHLRSIGSRKIPSLAEDIAYRRKKLGHWTDLVLVLLYLLVDWRHDELPNQNPCALGAGLNKLEAVPGQMDRRLSSNFGSRFRDGLDKLPTLGGLVLNE